MRISFFYDLEKNLDRLQQRQKFGNFVFDQNFGFGEANPSKNFPLSPENIFLVRVITLPRLTYGNLKIPGIEPSHTCKCETSDRNVFGGRIELDGRGDRRCGDPRDREYCDRDGGLEPKTIF